MKPYNNRRPQRSKEWGRKPKKPSGPPPFDVLMRRFKKKCERSGVVAEVRERQYYEKPSSRRQKKINAWKRKIKIDKIREEQALEAYKRSGRY
jgi:small subunit ribosomal protein S21|tara:strand:- start:801 stop:1079 length:279 start_codon:yes stop_codon:yes gene_type:complete